MDFLAWPVQQRMKFIEFSIYWEGEISRPKLQAQFQISPQQATKDLNRYQELASGNLVYSPQLRRYVSSDIFVPKFIEATAVEYLRHIDALRMEHKSKEEIWIDNVPSYDGTDLPGRWIDPLILKAILDAIKLKQSVDIEYVSLSSTNTGIRRITPHSICTDENRWHTRAYNHDGQRFSDYSLSRISRTGGFFEPAQFADRDDAWNTRVSIQVAPDDDLTNASSERLQIEYEMVQGSRKFSVRKAMLWYILRRLGFNPEPTDKTYSPARMRNESSFRLKLLNLEEIEVWLERRQ